MDLIANIFADGPSFDPYNPDKSKIRIWGTWVEGIITAFTSNGGLIYSSLAALNADLSKPANSMAWVMGDPIAANNGVYGKVGASGSGSWTRRSDLPFNFIIASDVGAGTPNAIQATTSIPVSGSALIWMNIAQTNGPGPVTVQFNGSGPVYTIKTNSGNDPEEAGLPSGMVVMGIVSGTVFRLISDQASAAILAQMESLLIETAAQTQQMIDDAVEQFTEETQELRDQAQNSADAAASSATEAQMYAEMVGAAVYDFNFDSDPDQPGYDWND